MLYSVGTCPCISASARVRWSMLHSRQNRISMEEGDCVTTNIRLQHCRELRLCKAKMLSRVYWSSFLQGSALHSLLTQNSEVDGSHKAVGMTNSLTRIANWSLSVPDNAVATA
eukprot:gb/GECG01010827.1/.p1 GENE.gb/GECG01010827.1/~~gb/GECG01010827.1/.p1  ORF type:complete len:113 (+),score=4.52 gb/GECG01010827.1/:1-339(+)